ncbi:ATP-binding protein [Chloroflexus sp.]|uniref:ATP-binding protein n=1 Tax=Chloroflexus sp. TaxID=1904827 RepID=UPI00298ED8BD|nr:AAA family ATPase [Chloroflexus sp.]MDW8405856.1 AAA family ATPase [Chloroflexus sp.]
MASGTLSVRIFLLGDVRFEVGSEHFSFPNRESLRRLLVRLVLRPRQPFGRKQLAFVLWPDSEPAEALANLRRHLYLLREALPPVVRPWLSVSTQEVGWHAPPDCYVDVAAFEQEWTTVAEMEAAAALYRGELAPSVDADDEILTRREALHRRYLLLLKTLARVWQDRSDWERVGEWARRLLALDSWDEEAVRWAMTAAALAGQRAAALDRYRALAAELQRELDAQPAPETTALYHDILHHRLAMPAPIYQSLATPLFIGRDDQLRQLWELIHHAGQGQGRIVFVSGPAGVGKTALVQEAIHRLPSWQVLRGYCQPARSVGEQQAYLPWRQILAATATRLVQVAQAGDWLARLALLAPELTLLRPGLVAPDQPDAAALRLAIRQALQVLASSQPLLVLIEDAHWIDQASLEALGEVADLCQSLPLLMIVTHRSGAITPALLAMKRALRRQRSAHDIAVPPFTTEETDRFLAQTLNQNRIDAATLADIRRYASGLPLLLREAVAALGETAQATKNSLHGLRDSLRLRLREIGEQNRQMLEAAAILGFSCADAVLQRMLAWSPAMYASALDELSARRLLVDTVIHGADDYAFSHHLIHELIVNDIPAERAKALHAQAAHALATVYAGQSGYAARVAHHYEQAGDRLQAARWWLDHARESTDLAAFAPASEAIAHAESLLSGASRAERELQARAAMQRGIVALYQGDQALALALLERAIMASREFPALYAQTLVMQAYVLYTRDQAGEAYTTATQALELAASLNDTVNLVRARNIRGVSALMLGQMNEAIADLRQACAAIETLRLSDEQGMGVIAQTAQSLNHLGTALVFAQEYRQARDVLEQTVTIAHRSGLRRLEAAALMMIGQMLLNCGRYDEAERVYTRSIEVAGESYKPGMWGKYAGRGWVYLRIGEHDAARRDFTDGLRIATQVKSQYGALLMQSYLTVVDLAQGQAPAWSLAQLAAQAEFAQSHPVVYIACLLAGQIRDLLDEPEQALAMYERAWRAAQASNVPAFGLTARARYLGRRLATAPSGDLWAELAQLGAQAERVGELPAQALIALARANGWLASDQAAQAAPAAEQAVMLARACPDLPLLGESLVTLSDICLRLGDTVRAQSALAEAQTIARQSFAPLAIPLGLPEAGRLRQHCLASLQPQAPDRTIAPRKRRGA